MAGGFGTRLYPLTQSRPKPMLPLGHEPVLAHILNLLQRHGFSDVILATNYRSKQIQDYFTDGKSRGLSLYYSVEPTPLGTAGSVKYAQSYLRNETFLVISGDIVTDIDLSEVVQAHIEKRALASLALTQVTDCSSYGVVITDSDGRVRQFLEKPGHQPLMSQFVNTGIYVLEPDVLDYIPPATFCDFSYDIFPQLLDDGASFFAWQTAGYWCDMGTIQSYQQAIADVQDGKVNLDHCLTDSLMAKAAISELARMSYRVHLWPSPLRMHRCTTVLH